MTVEERISALEGRLDVLEVQLYDISSALLGYVRADMATPWMGEAKVLEELLRRLTK